MRSTPASRPSAPRPTSSSTSSPTSSPGLRLIVRAPPGARFEQVPMMRGRITRLNGVPVEQASVAPDAQWALRSDRGLTYAAALPPARALSPAHWWPPDYQGPPLSHSMRRWPAAWGSRSATR